MLSLILSSTMSLLVGAQRGTSTQDSNTIQICQVYKQKCATTVPPSGPSCQAYEYSCKSPQEAFNHSTCAYCLCGDTEILPSLLCDEWRFSDSLIARLNAPTRDIVPHPPFTPLPSQDSSNWSFFDHFGPKQETSIRIRNILLASLIPVILACLVGYLVYRKKRSTRFKIQPDEDAMQESNRYLEKDPTLKDDMYKIQKLPSFQPLRLSGFFPEWNIPPQRDYAQSCPLTASSTLTETKNVAASVPSKETRQLKTSSDTMRNSDSTHPSTFAPILHIPRPTHNPPVLGMNLFASKSDPLKTPCGPVFSPSQSKSNDPRRYSKASFLSTDTNMTTVAKSPEYRYLVLSPWTPLRPDEIALQRGDHVIIYSIYEDGWCEGKITSKQTTPSSGFFPLNCVRVAEQHNTKRESTGTILNSGTCPDRTFSLAT